LLDHWISARETALARVRALRSASADRVSAFRDYIARARYHASQWRVADEIQSARIAALEADLALLEDHLATGVLDGTRPWDTLFTWAQDRLSVEGQEFLVTLMIEPYGDLVDDLANTMAADEERDFPIDGDMRLGTLRDLVRKHYAFAFGIDFSRPATQARFWYVSEEKLEPRLGERYEEPGADREQPLTIARDVIALNDALVGWEGKETVATFLMAFPEFRHVVRRIQTTGRRPYAEIRDNLIDAAVRPTDLLRCKLSFFGATRFDPKSDRWVRI